MASSSKVLLSSQKVDNVLDEILSDFESSLFDSHDNSSGIDDLPVGEAVALERTDDEDRDSARGENVWDVPSVVMFTWEDMTFCIG
jgi:hypothetical protein